MNNNSDQKLSGKQKAALEREARLKAALKTNMKRRKSQAKVRSRAIVENTDCDRNLEDE